MKDIQEVIRDMSRPKKAVFLGMQSVGYAGIASMFVAIVASPVNLAVMGVGAALSAVSFSAQAIFLNKEAKKQDKEIASAPKALSSALTISREKTNSKTNSVQKESHKTPPRVISSVRLSAKELKEIQRSKQIRR